jgi:hypothetical protein
MPRAASSATYLDRVMASAAARHAGADAANHAGQGRANHAEGGSPDGAPPPDTSRQIGQFGPLPSVLRPTPPGERKAGRDRGDTGKAKGRAIILYWLTGVFLGVVLVWFFASAFAQQPIAPQPVDSPPVKSAQSAPPKQQQPPAQKQQGQQQQLAMPVSTEQALYLIRSTLITLNDANRSGNYTVLRDLAAPDFQARNTAADLSQSFSDLRRRNFDLYGAALLAPQLTAVPALDQRGFLHLAGFFPTKPQQINFDLLFQDVAKQWRLFGISIATPDAPSAGR